MNTKVNKAYFLIPVVYVAVIVFLLYMQFSGSSGFSAEVAGISISGKTHSGAPGHEDTIPEMNVVSNDILFTFGEESPLLVFTQDGLIHRTEPVDYRVTASGVDIKLTKGIAVSFYHDLNNTNTLHISVSAEDPESIKYIRMPVTGKKAEIAQMAGVPVLSIKSESFGNFFLTMPNSSAYIPENSMIELFPEQDGVSDLTLEQTAGSGLDAFTYWISGNKTVITAEELEGKIHAYIENAAETLNGSRFNPVRGSWSSGSGSSVFSEEALIMAATEQIGTSAYRSTKEQLDRAALSHSRDLSIRSSALFGNIVNEGWAYEKKLEEEAGSMRRAAEAGDYSVFAEPDLVPVVLTENSESLINALTKLAGDLGTAEIDVPLAAAILGFYSEIDRKSPELGERFLKLTSVIDNTILPSVKIIADSIFVVADNNSADILNTVRIGILLSDARNKNLPADYAPIGRELVNSALKLSSSTGILPEKVADSGSGNLLTEGEIAPETVYPMLTDNKYYPSADYFYEETGEKISVLNQAGDFNIKKTDFGYRMVFDFPAGQTHTFAVRNIKPFYMIHLLGYRWNSDHRFLTYSSGWWYDKQNNTLFVKISHRNTTEEMLIYTERPADPVTPTETATTENEETSSAAEE